MISSVVVVVGSQSRRRLHARLASGAGDLLRPGSGSEALPSVAIGLWLNIRVMLVCGVLIAIFGLLVAVLRTLRGPVFFPVRAFAAGYTDLFRGLPLLLVIFLLGFGVPALNCAACPTARWSRAGRRWC